MTIQDARKERKEREAEAARLRIVSKALEVFGASGYHGTTMEDVALAAGYAVGSLYNYFDNKTALYRAVVEQVRGEIRDASPAAVPRRGAGFREQLLNMMLGQFEITERYRGFFASFYRERPSFEPGFGTEVDVLTQAGRTIWVEELTRLVTAGQRRGDVRPGDARSIAFVITGALEGWFQGWLRLEAQDDTDALLQEVVDLVCGGVCKTGGAAQ